MKTKGFTLVELLIAVAIFSVIALSLYSAFHTGTLSYQKTNAAFELYQTARGILSRIELDLRNSIIYLPTDSKFIGAQNSLDFLTILDTYKGTKSAIEFSRVKYSLQGDSLKRLCIAGLDAFKENIQQGPEELSSGITRLKFEFAKHIENQNPPYQWQDTWTKEDSQKFGVPAAVKITLTINQSDEFTKIVPLELELKANK